MSTIQESPQQIEDSIRFTGGKSVEYQAHETWGHHEWQDEVLFGDDGGVTGKREIVRVATGMLTGLKKGQPITVNGISREIADYHPAEDGALTEIVLRHRNPRNRAHYGG